MKTRPAKIIVAIMVLISIVIAAGWAFRATDAITNLNAINRQITQETRFSSGVSTDLKKQSLKDVSSSDVAYLMIKAAGYKNLEISQLPSFLRREVQEGVRFFHRPVNGSLCTLDYYVILHSSIEDDIEAALGLRRERNCQ